MKLASPVIVLVLVGFGCGGTEPAPASPAAPDPKTAQGPQATPTVHVAPPAATAQAQAAPDGDKADDPDPAQKKEAGELAMIGVLGGSQTRPRQIMLGDITMGKGLPPEVVQRIVRKNADRLKLCYGNSLKNDPKLEGKVTVQFTITKDGAVRSASSAGSTVPSKEMIACVTGAFRGLSFPEPDGGVNVSVTYPIRFRPGDAPATTTPAPASAPANKP